MTSMHSAIGRFSNFTWAAKDDFHGRELEPLGRSADSWCRGPSQA